MTAGKTKPAAVLLAVCLIGGAAVWLIPGPRASVAPRPQAPAAAPPRRDADRSLEVHGRVLDADGKPLAGAKLSLLSETETLKPLGTSAADGRFTVAVPRQAKRPYLIAQADGAGFDFLDVGSWTPAKRAELRLVKDNPIRGRVVNTEGKPVRGVRVTAWQIDTYFNNSLDSFTAAWMNLFVAHGQGLGTAKSLWTGAASLFAAVTDADGRFTLRGVGAERTVRLHLRGGGIADSEAWVVNRAGFDPRPYNAANTERDRRGGRSVNWRWWVLSGPDFSLVAAAEKVIRGTVTDADTGEPRPGAEVLLSRYDDEPLQHSPRAKADAQGRFEIHGARKAKSYLVVALNDAAAGYVSSQVWADDTAGYQPVAVRLKVKKGVVVTGRVIDGTSGEALSCLVMAAVLNGNPFVKEYPPFEPLFMSQCHSSGHAEAGGPFRLVTLPGPVLLMTKAKGPENVFYRWAGADPKYPQYFARDGGVFYGHNLMAPLQGHCTVLDIKPGTAEVKQDVVLHREKVLTRIRVEDAEGRPVTGAWVAAGGREFWVPYFGLRESSSCPVYGKPSGEPRRLLVYHPERKLAGSLLLKGDEKRPLVVRLGPAGAVRGRLLDADGTPPAGMVVDLNYREDEAQAIRHRVHEGKQIVTDVHGAFAFDEVIPASKFELSFRRGTRTYRGEPRVIEVKPGECRDLGTVRVKPVREEPEGEP